MAAGLQVASHPWAHHGEAHGTLCLLGLAAGQHSVLRTCWTPVCTWSLSHIHLMLNVSVSVDFQKLLWVLAKCCAFMLWTRRSSWIFQGYLQVSKLTDRPNLYCTSYDVLLYIRSLQQHNVKVNSVSGCMHTHTHSISILQFHSWLLVQHKDKSWPVEGARGTILWIHFCKRSPAMIRLWIKLWNLCTTCSLLLEGMFANIPHGQRHLPLIFSSFQRINP